MNINPNTFMPYPLSKARENTQRIRQYLNKADALDNSTVRNLIHSIDFFSDPTLKGVVAC